MACLVFALAACGGRTSSSDAAAGPDQGTIGSGGGASSPATAVDAKTLDTLTLGDNSSEMAHGLVMGFSTPQATIEPLPSHPSTGPAGDTVAGQFGLTARRLLPRRPNADYYGGQMNFSMSVHPEKQSYVTLKTWGSDKSPPWLVLDVEGREVGWRHGGTDELIFQQTTGWYPGGFAYRTMRLPFHLTRGKTSVKITLRSLGEMAYYANNTYNDRQQRMSAPTVPMYAVYTHTGAQLDVSAERQGTASPGTVRSAENGDSFVAGWKKRVNNKINSALATAPESLTPFQLQLLAQSYSVGWSAGFQNSTVLSQVRNGMDAMTRAYAASPGAYISRQGNGSWGGWLGEAGEAVRLLKAPLAAELDAAVDFGGALGTAARRTAWATALRAGVDYGRMNRQSVTNQAFWGAWRIYIANRALLEIQPSLALKESEARRYLYEAAGISPWLGNDSAGGGDTPVRGSAPLGPNWYMVTSDGTSKEDCLVGGDYGEVGGIVMRWAVDIGDAQLKAQAIKMLRARAALRYPGPDVRGHHAFVVADAIGCRNTQEVGEHVAYLGRAEVEDLLVASLGPEEVGRDLVGYAQQAMADGNFLSRLGPDDSYASIRVPEYFERFKALAETDVKLPMSDGQPDFAWADRENMAIAAKAGNERFWVVLNWKNAQGLNRLARVFVTTPQNVFTAEVGIEDIRYTPAGRTIAARGAVDSYNPPPDNPTNANSDLVYPAARRADLAVEPVNNRDAGRADAYTLRYGRWLVALNAHPTKNYEVKTPVGFTSAVDLASRRTLSGTVTIAPRSYAVLRLPNVSTAAVSPFNPLQVLAAPAGAGSVLVTWEQTPGASGYVVSRAETAVGPFVPISGKVNSTSWTHVGASSGYYQVQAVDEQGNASGPSPVASPAASASIGASSNSRWSSRGAARGFASAPSISQQSGVGDTRGSADALHRVDQLLTGNEGAKVHVALPAVIHQLASNGAASRDYLTRAARHLGVRMFPPSCTSGTSSGTVGARPASHAVARSPESEFEDEALLLRTTVHHPSRT